MSEVEASNLSTEREEVINSEAVENGTITANEADGSGDLNTVLEAQAVENAEQSEKPVVQQAETAIEQTMEGGGEEIKRNRSNAELNVNEPEVTEIVQEDSEASAELISKEIMIQALSSETGSGEVKSTEILQERTEERALEGETGVEEQALEDKTKTEEQASEGRTEDQVPDITGTDNLDAMATSMDGIDDIPVSEEAQQGADVTSEQEQVRSSSVLEVGEADNEKDNKMEEDVQETVEDSAHDTADIAQDTAETPSQEEFEEKAEDAVEDIIEEEGLQIETEELFEDEANEEVVDEETVAATELSDENQEELVDTEAAGEAEEEVELMDASALEEAPSVDDSEQKESSERQSSLPEDENEQHEDTTIELQDEEEDLAEVPSEESEKKLAVVDQDMTEELETPEAEEIKQEQDASEMQGSTAEEEAELGTLMNKHGALADATKITSKNISFEITPKLPSIATDAIRDEKEFESGNSLKKSTEKAVESQINVLKADSEMIAKEIPPAEQKYSLKKTNEDEKKSDRKKPLVEAPVKEKKRSSKSKRGSKTRFADEEGKSPSSIQEFRSEEVEKATEEAAVDLVEVETNLTEVTDVDSSKETEIIQKVQGDVTPEVVSEEPSEKLDEVHVEPYEAVEKKSEEIEVKSVDESKPTELMREKPEEKKNKRSEHSPSPVSRKTRISPSTVSYVVYDQDSKEKKGPPPRMPISTSFSSHIPVEKSAYTALSPWVQDFSQKYRNDYTAASAYKPPSTYTSLFDDIVNSGPFSMNLYSSSRLLERSRSRSREYRNSLRSRRSLSNYQRYTSNYATPPIRTRDYSTPPLASVHRLPSYSGSFISFMDYSAQKQYDLTRTASRFLATDRPSGTSSRSNADLFYDSGRLSRIDSYVRNINYRYEDDLPSTYGRYHSTPRSFTPYDYSLAKDRVYSRTPAFEHDTNAYMTRRGHDPTQMVRSIYESRIGDLERSLSRERIIRDRMKEKYSHLSHKLDEACRQMDLLRTISYTSLRDGTYTPSIYTHNYPYF